MAKKKTAAKKKKTTKPAAKSLHGKRFSGESARNRAAPHTLPKSAIERLGEVARGRGWRNLRLLSSAGNTYNRDYFGETENGSQMPMLNVFAKRDGRVHHTYATEMLFAPSERGQDGRHVDSIWPLWNLFDLIPEGRGTNWYPKLRY